MRGRQGSQTPNGSQKSRLRAQKQVRNTNPSFHFRFFLVLFCSSILIFFFFWWICGSLCNSRQTSFFFCVWDLVDVVELSFEQRRLHRPYSWSSSSSSLAARSALVLFFFFGCCWWASKGIRIMDEYAPATESSQLLIVCLSSHSKLSCLGFPFVKTLQLPNAVAMNSFCEHSPSAELSSFVFSFFM